MHGELEDPGVGVVHYSTSDQRVGHTLIQIVAALQLKVTERHEGRATNGQLQDRTRSLQVGDPDTEKKICNKATIARHELIGRLQIHDTNPPGKLEVFIELHTYICRYNAYQEYVVISLFKFTAAINTLTGIEEDS